jgi:DUF1009 family protein
MTKIGIIAGAGEFPAILAEECRKQGVEPVVVAIREEADPRVEEIAPNTHWEALGKVGKILKHLKGQGVEQVVLAGKVHKTRIFKDFRPDLKALTLLWALRDRKDDTILGKVAEVLSDEGITLISQTTYMQNYLPGAEVFTKRHPSHEEMEDINFGASIAREMGRLDIGQTVVVKRGAVLAVEAIEGTDQAILRGGSLGSRDVVVVKVAKPGQDLRFDVPAVGLATVQVCVDAGAKVLAFEASKTFFFQRQAAIDLANRNKICVTAF